MRISKKIFTIILSISLLVVISCGDRPTGSGDVDNQIDALLTSFPKPTGNPISDSSLNGSYKSQNKLTIVPEETKLINHNQSKEDFNKENAEKEISLEINNGMVTCKSTSTEILIDGKQLYDKNKKYSASEEKYYPGDGVNNTSLYYIEFDINTLTFKFTELIRISGTYNYAYQATYTGILTKDTSSGN